MRHVHSSAHLQQPTVIGHTRNGVPVWSIAGADDGGDDGADEDEDEDDEDSNDGQDDEESDSDQDEDSDDDEDEELGPKGVKALREMKKRARAAERETRQLRAKLEQSSSDDDDGEDPAAIRERIQTEVRAEAARDRALDKVEAKAARKFQNPDLVRKLLADQADDFLDDKGNPDVEAINEALTELLEDEPYLAVQDGKRFKGSGDGGSRNGTKKAGQLTRDDLKRMSPEEIVKARNEGRLDNLLEANS